MAHIVRILGFVGALTFLSLVVAVPAQACGGASCEMCDGKASADHADKSAEKSKVATKTTPSGRKLKCSKCADHSEAKAGTADASAPAAAEAEAPAT